jgi:hypothetical protein
MAVIVVAGSPGVSQFAIVNFGNTPPSVAMISGFDGGNMVDCYGTVAAVGAYDGMQILLYDISDPAWPLQLGSVTVPFQVMSMAIDSAYLIAGQDPSDGSQVVLVNISNPSSPYVESISNCAPFLNIISNVALRSPGALAAGDNNCVLLNFADPAIGAVPIQVLYNATGPCDFDGQTAAVADLGTVHAYKVAGVAATELSHFSYASYSVAAAEIPDGGYFVAAGGGGTFTLYAYPDGWPMGSLKTVISTSSDSLTAVKFLNNPAIAPYLAVANVTGSGVSISNHLIQVTTGGATGVSFFTPIEKASVALSTTVIPTLGVTAFTPTVRFRWIPWWPGWLAGFLRALGLGG